MHGTRTKTLRWRRAGLVLTAALSAGVAIVVTPAGASAAPGDPASVEQRVAQAAQQVTLMDGQVEAAALVVQERQQAASTARDQAAAAQAAVDALEPQLRAIAQTGFAGGGRTRVAALLTSESADDLVAQLTTLDMLATRADSVIAQATAAREAAAQAQAGAEQAAAEAQSLLDQLEDQQAQLQRQVDAYQAEFARLSSQQQTAVTAAVSGPVLAAPSADAAAAGAPNEIIATAIRTAMAQLGDPYVWGAAGPDGFDCSGLTMYAFAAAGVNLPHSSGAQSRMGTPVARADLRPGDLVFYYSPVSHVAIYIGDGKIVHARTFGQPVNVTSVDMAGYAFARRIVGG